MDANGSSKLRLLPLPRMVLRFLLERSQSLVGLRVGLDAVLTRRIPGNLTPVANPSSFYMRTSYEIGSQIMESLYQDLAQNMMSLCHKEVRWLSIGQVYGNSVGGLIFLLSTEQSVWET
jgi:hypothetical protein